jgi:hypothetical protein
MLLGLTLLAEVLETLRQSVQRSLPHSSSGTREPASSIADAF